MRPVRFTPSCAPTRSPAATRCFSVAGSTPTSWDSASRKARRCSNELWAHVTRRRVHLVPGVAGRRLVLWDNRCVMHRRNAFDGGQRRIMHRTQIAGDKPVRARTSGRRGARCLIASPVIRQWRRQDERHQHEATRSCVARAPADRLRARLRVGPAPFAGEVSVPAGRSHRPVGRRRRIRPDRTNDRQVPRIGPEGYLPGGQCAGRFRHHRRSEAAAQSRRRLFIRGERRLLRHPRQPDREVEAGRLHSPSR